MNYICHHALGSADSSVVQHLILVMWSFSHSDFKQMHIGQMSVEWTLPLCEYVSRYHLHLYQISARSDFKYGCRRLVAILEYNMRLLLAYMADYLQILIMGTSSKAT
jgi:hypothetical protein